MIEEYGIEPTLEQCCSMIRLMGQRGVVESRHGFGECRSDWRALLGACRKCSCKGDSVNWLSGESGDAVTVILLCKVR